MSADERSQENSDGGYVHRPGGPPDVEAGSGPAASDAHAVGADDAPADADLGVRGWVLVGVVILATLVIPGIIYLFPASPDRAGIPFLVAMLALPMVPAVLLGAVAVWSAVAGRRAGE